MPDTSDSLDRMPILMLPTETGRGFVQALHLAAALRTSNTIVNGLSLSPHAGPIAPDALVVAFDRVIEMVADRAGSMPQPVWKAASIGDRYLRLVQLATFALAAAEEVALEKELADTRARAAAAYLTAGGLRSIEMEV